MHQCVCLVIHVDVNCNEVNACALRLLSKVLILMKNNIQKHLIQRNCVLFVCLFVLIIRQQSAAVMYEAQSVRKKWRTLRGQS